MKFHIFKQRRARVWHRLGVLVGMLMLAVFAVVYEVYNFEHEDLLFAESELRGAEYLLPLHSFVHAINDHRRVTAETLGNRGNLQQALQEPAAKVQQAAAAMDAAELKYSAALGQGAEWQRIKQLWTRLQQQVRTLDLEQALAGHDAIRDAAMAVNSTVLTRSNLLLDPVKESYFLMDLSMVRLLDASNKLATLGDGVRHALVRGSITNEEELQFAGLSAVLKEIELVVADEFKQAVADEPDFRQRLQPLYSAYESALDKALADVGTIEREGLAQTQFSIPVAAFVADNERAISTLVAFDDAAERELETLLQQRIADSRFTQNLYIGLGSAGILLALLVAVLVTRSVTRPLGHLADVSRRVAGGDTAARAQLLRTDEIGEFAMQFDIMVDQQVSVAQRIQDENEQLNNSIVALLQGAARLSQRDLTSRVPVAEDVTGAISDALNAMAEETAKVLSEVLAVAQQTSLSAQEVKSQANSVMDVASEERKVVQLAATQLEEASVRMTQVADLATRCNEAARLAISTTERAQGTVLGTVEGIASIRETIRETEKRIKRLGERSQEISGVVSLINTIAERTHILALNASMHAASAGEAGRGFAVVANEVQRLAESAREATSKIATLVSNIQVETSDTVVTMNEAITRVVSGTELAERAGTEMKSTRETTAGLAQLVEQIAKQSAEQAVVSRALRDQASELVRSTTQTYDQLDSQRGHTDLLVEYSGALLDSVNVFTLPKRETAAPAARTAAQLASDGRRAATRG